MRRHPATLVVCGEIDVDSVHRLDDAWSILASWATSDGPLEIDLGGVTFFSAAGVGRLVAWSRAPGPPLRIVASDPVLRLLAICGVTMQSPGARRRIDVVARARPERRPDAAPDVGRSAHTG